MASAIGEKQEKIAARSGKSKKAAKKARAKAKNKGGPSHQGPPRPGIRLNTGTASSS